MSREITTRKPTIPRNPKKPRMLCPLLGFFGFFGFLGFLRQNAMVASHDPYIALKDPNFRPLFFGIAFAATIFQARSIAIGWEIYERTGSAGALGLLGLILFLPMLFLALPAGHLADRVSHQKILIYTSLAGALSAAGLAAWSGMQLPMWVMYALLFFAGILNAVGSPARLSLIHI